MNLNSNISGYSALREARRRSSALSSLSGRQYSTGTDVTTLDDLEEFNFDVEDEGENYHHIGSQTTEYQPGAEIAVTAADVTQLWAVQEEDDNVSQLSEEIWGFLRREPGSHPGPLSGTTATLATADSYSADLESIHNSEADLRSNKDQYGSACFQDIFINKIEEEVEFTHSEEDDSCDDEVADSLTGIEYAFPPVLRFAPDDISSSVASLATSVCAVAAAQHKRVSFRQ